MMRLLASMAFLLTLAQGLIAQRPGTDQPQNDLCARAIELLPGDRRYDNSNAEAMQPLEYERPATEPTTCIQTIENDLWFKFTATEAHALYEVQIVANACSTPAGLQALLIEADGCSANHFIYRGCSNKINTDTIKLFLDAPKPGQNYYVWVDGYDGTICDFEIALLGRPAKQPMDYKFMRFDYAFNEPEATMLPGLRLEFSNNAATLEWESDTREGNALFVVEMLPDLEDVPEESRYARVVGFVTAKPLVGQGTNHYVFMDYLTPFLNGQNYRYRVVLVSEDGKRSVSEILEAKAAIVSSFDVREVKPATEPGKYVVHYINRKKGQKFDVSVLDASGSQVKHMVLDNQPVQDGDITIDMSSFDAGEYFFVMAAGKHSFKRSFMHLPH